MAHPNPFTLLFDALLRPARFAASLDGGWRPLLWAALAVAVAEALLAALGFVAFVLWQIVPLGTRGLAAGLLLAPLMALMFSGVWVTIGGDMRISSQANAAFWIARCQLAITPPLAVGLALAFNPAFQQLQQSAAVGLLLPALFGAWAGGALTVTLVKHRERADSAAARWVLAVGGASVAAVAWWSPALRSTDWWLLVPLGAGLAVGLLRPFSYLWEAPVSLMLLAAAQARVSPLRLLGLHPAGFDELCLLPLPGLSSLLVRAFAADPDACGEWLLRIANHAGQRHAAERAVIRSIRDGRLAHPILFWLSTSTGGASLLRDMADRPRLAHPLLASYADFGAIESAGAWSSTIARHRPAIAHAAVLPGGAALFALLEAASGVLRADRWPAAIAGLGDAPPPHGVEDGPIWVALDMLREWAQRGGLAHDRATMLADLGDELRELEGWPAALIAAMGEHLLFLLGVEQRRGTCLV